ncbi:MAG: bifunctional adenosylcobinamide kinase/adenosylcobinamide-phosphate guanylyltransferase [endosymbiont of Seepiophila jonesi]|uniref:Bifunctional adenosylcobalamin biosynthesis protein n=1 Tax=endosymbiont of Lamellibrachia luymesi TaxID=2200907 RepID=A0A370DY78_9GAMM|nr:MAG: bifunctional adenosylcobinamide kinase/adenosylcobinamide-phosphate guanylyltransferase [endosymbiont of Seepiophila jonesi]RDH91212.1 MAG: bifunctional adenosylcobinamide kinase/adenosylcobinamide-phosphate guanylyltransferase [endosymbiont of Lamellibrachia luymesi]
MKTLILGGVRSGKSRLAQQYARDSGLPVSYIATARAEDDKMQQRIEQHRNHRPADWLLVEEPLALGETLQNHAAPSRCLLVECLTLWLTNLLLDEDAQRLAQEKSALLALLPTLPGEIILVANETGLGVVPMGELSRRFCDEAGMLHQAIAQRCDKVVLTVAGLPHVLKQPE